MSLFTNRIFISLVIVFFHLTIYSQKHEKTLLKSHLKSDDYYFSGEYRKAIKLNETATKKLVKSLKEEESPYTYYTSLKKIKYQEGYGMFDNMDADIERYVKKTASFEDKPFVHYKALLEAVKIYYSFGNIKKADAYLSDLESKENLSYHPDFYSEVLLKRMQIDLKNGNFELVLKKRDDVLSHIKSTFEKKYEIKSSIDDASETHKRSHHQINANLMLYASALNTASAAYIYRGDYAAADTSLENTTKWIRKKGLGKSSISYVSTLELYYDYYKMINEIQKSRKSIEQALTVSEKSKGYKLKPYSKQYISLYERLNDALLNLNEGNNYRKVKSEIEPFILRYYPKKSFANYRLKLLDTKKDFHKQNYEKSLKDLFKLIDASSDVIPEKHPILTHYYEAYLDKYQYLENKALYEDVSKRYDDQIQDIYSTEKPIFHLTQVFEANHMIVNNNQYDQAEKIYQNSFDSVVAKHWHPQHKDYQSWINTRAIGYIQKDEYQKAEDILRDYDRQIDTYMGYLNLPKAISLQQIGDLSIQQGDYNQSFEKLNKATTIYNEIKETKNIHYMYTLRSRARLYMVQGDYENAEKVLEKALAVAKANKQESEFNVEEFVSLYINQGKYHKIDKLLKQSLETKIKKYGRGHISLIDTYKYLGEIEMIFANYIEADKNLRMSERLCQDILGRESIKYTTVERTRASLQEALGDFQNAEFSYLAILEIQEKILGREHVDVARTLHSLAITKFLNKRPTHEVETVFDEALTIIERKIGNENPMYASVLMDKADFYIETDRLEKADLLLRLADKIWEDNSELGKNNIHSAQIIMMRANIARKRQQYKQSLSLYENAVKMYKKIFSDRHPDYVYALSKTAQLHYILGDVAQANDLLEETTTKYLTFITKYFPALSEREKARYWTRIKDDFEFYNTVAFKNEKKNESMVEQVYNNVLATKALLLNSSIKIRKSIQSSGDSLLIASYNQWVDKREYLTSIAGFSDEQLKNEGVNFNTLEQEIESLERYLSESSEVFRKGSKKLLINWRAIKEQLVDNEYAVEIIRYRHFDKDFTDSIAYAALVISPETKKAPQVVHFPLGYQFETKYIKYYRNSIKYKVDDKWSYEALWQPFEKVIPEGARVYFSPEGVYNQLNIEAIKLKDDRYLIDRNEFVIISNTKDLLERKQVDPDQKLKSKDRQAILMGNPAFYHIRERKDSVMITLEDKVYAQESDRIFIEITDNITATSRDDIKIYERDKVLTTIEDSILISTEDQVFAHEQDSIYIQAEDNVKKFDELVTIEDSIIATIYDEVLISTSDSILARDYHQRIIKERDNVWAEQRHKKKISLSDKVYARAEHNIFITESDHIVNGTFYNKLTVSQLPGAASEIETLTKLLKKNKWKTQDFLFDKATEDTLKSFVSPKIFHIATHGFFASDARQNKGVEGYHKESTNRNPLLKSGLILEHGGDIIDQNTVFDYNKEQGILTAYEAMSLNFDNTELVVLSACETGLGEVQVGEGVYGLQRSFLVAGAKSIIMSLFKVSDEATLKLMSLFYEKWLQGMEKRKAFVEAKKELRKEFKEPIYWGAFIMIGS